MRAARAVVLALTLAAVACGSGVGRGELGAALGSLTAPAPPAPHPPSPVAPGGAAAPAPAPEPGRTAPVLRPATPESPSVPPRVPAVPSAAGSQAGKAAVATAAGSAGTDALPGDQATRPGAGTAAVAEPIVIGSVGTLSGPVGADMQGGPLAVRVWARATNARGGLSGHEVTVVVADDGSDPGRYQAMVRDLVENKKVVAFVSNMAAFTLAAGRSYLEAKRVPVIGGDLTSQMWHESPMFFPQSGGEQAMIWGMVANAAAAGRHRFGSLACRESQGCQNAERYWFDEGWVEEAGLEPAYRAQISIAQPDYTAECLSASRAGVDVLAVVADGATARRVAVSCDRQGYHPTYTISGPTVDDRVAAANTGALEGTLAAVVTFPYVVDDTPATAEFHDALARYGTGETLLASTAQGWVAAKLFERVATATDPTRAENILQGLWSLQGETLGGLTAPRTFAREGANPDLRCFFVMKLAGKSWTAPLGASPVCHP